MSATAVETMPRSSARDIGRMIAAATRFRPLPGPLQSARTSASMVWLLMLGLTAVAFDNPIILTAVLTCELIAAARCGVLGKVVRTMLLALPVALLVALINPIVTRQGVTVLIEGFRIPVLGQMDITLEAVVYGLILGFKMIVILGCSALYVGTVDPDDLLRLLRRYSVRSALTASLAVRLVPVLATDFARLDDARRCRPGAPASRRKVAGAVFSRAFDRAESVSIALETRGFSTARRLRRSKSPWSRADMAIAAGAVGITTTSVAAIATKTGGLVAYPLLQIDSGIAEAVLCVALLTVTTASLFAAGKGSQP